MVTTYLISELCSLVDLPVRTVRYYVQQGLVDRPEGESLRDGDRFSLSRFGDSVEHRCKALWKVAPPSMVAAQRWAQRLEADLGGRK